MEDFKKEQLEINRNMAEHARVSNMEMGVLKNDVAWIKDKMVVFERRFDKLDSRVWWILGTIILGFLANIYFK